MLLLIQFAFAPFGRRDLAGGRGRKEPVEDQPGVDLLGHRHVGRPPGDVRGIGTAIAGIAVARLRLPVRFPARETAAGFACRPSGRPPGRPKHPRGCRPRRSSSAWTPVKKLASERAWSPGPSPRASALCWASRSGRADRPGKAPAAASVPGSVKFGPVFAGNPVGQMHAVGHVEKRHAPRHGARAVAAGQRLRAIPWPRARAGRWPRPNLAGAVRLDSRFARFIRISPFIRCESHRVTLGFAPFLEWVALDDGQHQGRKAVTIGFQGFDDLIDGAAVSVLPVRARGRRSASFRSGSV